MNIDNILRIAGRFSINGNAISAEPVGNGWINDTFRIVTDSTTGPDYILQRINHNVFKDVDTLQNNIKYVTGHIRRKLQACGTEDLDRKVLTVIETREGGLYINENGEYWRAYTFISDAVTYEKVDEESSRMAGLAFGEFEHMLSDVNPEILGETIPRFHDMEFRIEEFESALSADRTGRAKETEDLILEVRKRKDGMCIAERMYREGKLPKRICHCDTKVNNMMFDRNGNFLCVIDLDTVMPSFVFSDIGDFLRSAANTGEEDDRNPDNVNFNMSIFKAFIGGYIESAGKFLTDTEKEMIPFAVALFPYMQFVRFFTDYLNGDTYYKIKYPEHNLVRSRAQLKLLQSIESQMPEIKAAVREITRQG